MYTNKQIISLCTNFYKIIEFSPYEDDIVSQKLVKLYQQYIFRIDINNPEDVESVINLDKVISKYIDDLSHCTAYYYNVAGYNDADGVAHEAAVISKPYYQYVSSLTDRSTWDYGALHTTQNAVGFSAGLIYRLFSIRT